MRLRQEVLLILSHAGVSPAHLIHMDDAEFHPLLRLIDRENPTFQVILVDHNEADGLLKGKVDGRVVEILDHHKDQEAEEGSHVRKRVIAFNEKRGVPLMSSACSVVADQYLKTKLGRQLLQQDSGAVAASLLSVIVIDSKDLDEASKRDKEIVKELEANVCDKNNVIPFKVLQDKKTNPAFWAGETLEANFLYDFKQFEAGGMTCGISSTFISLDVLLHKLEDQKDASAMDEYLDDPVHPGHDSETQSSVFMIMLKQAPHMYLAVASKHRELLNFSQTFMMGAGAANLQLTRVEQHSKHVAEMSFYNQHNHHASRKQVGPDCQAMLAAFCHVHTC